MFYMKTLIYLEESKLAPKGGPYAVGYYIQQELIRQNRGDVDFIKDDNVISAPTKVTNGLMRFAQNCSRIYHRYKRFKKLFSGNGIPKVDINQFDVVHFHKTIDMLECQSALKGYKGKVILTSHSPVPLSKEFYDEYLLPFERKYMKGFYSQLITMDEYAFQRADFIHFPCEEAEDPYLNNWSEYKLIKQQRKEHYRYIPTGIPSAMPKRGRGEVRKELNIPEEDFCISYVGRHNAVKGYDKLKEMGECLLEDEHTWFTIAGREEPLHGLTNNRWIEIGWTNDAHSYIAASDVFVLPNKETYFDIVMLEVLSLGKIVVASRTGGNKYFEKFKPNGVFLYDTIEEAVSYLKRIQSMSMSERQKLGDLNKKMYSENFTDKVFVERYYQFIKSI